ncbi:MAG: ABC transporter permease [Armatimonadetes bacterium]|nr:ABC transporter permease [Armatimonadota bacterium]
MQRSSFGHYILRRLWATLPTLLGVTLIIFFAIRLLPGDPARLVAGLLASPEEVERIRRTLGLDRPAVVQYFDFLLNLLRGDLGTSTVTRAPVLAEILQRMSFTAGLATASVTLAVLLGLTAGIISAVRHYSSLDYAVMAMALFGISIPVFWLGLMLMLLFAVKLHWVPAGGYSGPASLVLPAVTLAAFSQAIIARMTRSSMLESLRQDYVRTARAKGLPQRTVVVRHALKNAMIPVITVVGLQFGTLLGGAVLTETTFAWPGIGRLLVNAISSRDYPMIQGIVILFAVTFTLVNLAVDLLYGYVDPRIRLE